MADTKTVCCEGGDIGAGCYHDHCTGPVTVTTYIGNGTTQRIPIDRWPILLVREVPDGSGEDT